MSNKLCRLHKKKKHERQAAIRQDPSELQDKNKKEGPPR